MQPQEVTRDNENLEQIPNLSESQSSEEINNKKPKKIRPKTVDIVSQYTIDCVRIKTFNSIQEASIETGIRSKDILNNIYGRCKDAGGYRWGYDIDIYAPKLKNKELIEHGSEKGKNKLQ